MTQRELGSPLIYSTKLELLGYMDSDAVVASEIERRIRPLVLEGLRANAE